MHVSDGTPLHRHMSRTRSRIEWPSTTIPNVEDSPSRDSSHIFFSPRHRHLQLIEWLAESPTPTREGTQMHRSADLVDMDQSQLIVWDDDQEELRVDLSFLDRTIAAHRHVLPESAAFVDEVHRSRPGLRSSRLRVSSGSVAGEGGTRRDGLHMLRGHSLASFADRPSRSRRHQSCRRKEIRGVSVSRFPIVKFEGPAADIGPQECAICLDNFSEGQQLRLAPCGATKPRRELVSESRDVSHVQSPRLALIGFYSRCQRRR
eukprot:CAMPEP_0115274324 /NCGR_PEP_ID=MMETSP0270-20121206/55614_1 /TAXON_ID=71861 /ORGANISM="Scrippsiella trochoidea, Strain CCMP3099" /LENGTH=260 /DNA_ID=CAMNT_0002690827 /DNA_START=134 /DNA_END=913 /DNA_ORIENTATION=+